MIVQYDLSVTTYSPDGRVFQVEYANKAVEKSGYVRLDYQKVMTLADWSHM